MSSDFVALFQYVNNASRKMKNIEIQIKGSKHTKILNRRINISSQFSDNDDSENLEMAYRVQITITI